MAVIALANPRRKKRAKKSKAKRGKRKARRNPVAPMALAFLNPAKKGGKRRAKKGGAKKGAKRGKAKRKLSAKQLAALAKGRRASAKKRRGRRITAVRRSKPRIGRARRAAPSLTVRTGATTVRMGGRTAGGMIFPVRPNPKPKKGKRAKAKRAAAKRRAAARRRAGSTTGLKQLNKRVTHLAGRVTKVETVQKKHSKVVMAIARLRTKRLSA